MLSGLPGLMAPQPTGKEGFEDVYGNIFLNHFYIVHIMTL